MNIFFKFVSVTTIWILTLGCFGYEIPNLANSERQLENKNNVRKNNFDKHLFSKENFSTISTNIHENDTYFWAIHQMTDTIRSFTNNNITEDYVTETDNKFTEILQDTEIKSQNNITAVEEITTFSQEDFLQNENYETHTTDITLQEYETMFLTRSNCNLEISINNFDVTKIHFKFETLKNYSAGSCCITLKGSKNTKLAVIITDIFLVDGTRNKNEVETLTVISKNHGVDFILKKYDQKQINQPVLLSESSRVFVFLQYNVTTIAAKNFNTKFNLEVFNYGRNVNPFWNNSYMYKNSGI